MTRWDGPGGDPLGDLERAREWLERPVDYVPNMILTSRATRQRWKDMEAWERELKRRVDGPVWSIETWAARALLRHWRSRTFRQRARRRWWLWRHRNDPDY